jgi:speckle-type POZ protein
VAADRYGLQRLRAMCEKRLCDEIAVGTATTILALAEQHRCGGLKAACYEFLRCPSNLRAVVATEDGFDHLCRSCPPVMKDLILGMLEKAPK